MVAAQIKDTAQSNLAQSCVMTLRVVHTSRYGTPRQHKHACISRLVPVSSIGIQSSQPCMGSLLGHVSRPRRRLQSRRPQVIHRCAPILIMGQVTSTVILVPCIMWLVAGEVAMMTISLRMICVVFVEVASRLRRRRRLQLRRPQLIHRLQLGAATTNTVMH